MIEQSVAYAQQRKQFGRAIGSFQAVKHMCAEMIAALEPARSLLWYAAHSFDALPDEAPQMACHVLAHVSEIGREIASTARRCTAESAGPTSRTCTSGSSASRSRGICSAARSFSRERAAALQGLTNA
jgi:alkylation response protein AidB-like acyl-CoA dehydrogenase